MPSQPINDVIDLSLPTGKVAVDVTAYLGYSFDLNLNSSDAEGNVFVYCQNTNPATDTYNRPPIKTYVVSGGTFANGRTSQIIDSAFLSVADYCVITWEGTSGSGTLDIIGSRRVFF